MKIKFRERLYIGFLAVFTIYTLVFIVFIVFIFIRDKNYKDEVIYKTQDIYITETANYITLNNIDENNINELAQINEIFPKELRVSILNKDGYIIYDNILPESEWTSTRKENLEVRHALISGEGKNIRTNEFNKKTYIFYAKLHNNLIIRVGYEYGVKIIKTNFYFWCAVALLYITMLIFLTSFYKKYGSAIKDLKKFVLSYYNDEIKPSKTISDDDLGDIQNLIIKLNNKLETNKKDVEVEKEKLLQHLQYAEEGISFFTFDRKNIYTNSRFIQYLNVLLETPTFDVNSIFSNPLFSEVVNYLRGAKKEKTFKTKIASNGRYFLLKVIVFEDKSFEIILKDITQTEKAHLDRTQITNNIAHELRTPVTSVRGYLETLIENETINPEKQREFISRAYSQINRLTEIIQDVALLSKVSDISRQLEKEDINIYELLEELIAIDSSEKIKDNNSKVVLEMDKNIVVKGNRTLLASALRNLGHNALKYAGEGITITINCYAEDEEFYYFSFSDNGIGVKEEYLPKIFERFFRGDEGRTRDQGGSGLGLSIVRDAIEFHHGEIIAKNKTEGGLEFLFSIRKY
ncbi:two-component system phosphate regulon sensor histidine kinase PhoR [Dysgonomonadaceae bacterium PH5-43]|nr:two-component system phosphate regulon sensor histidine kinase PhoR [Dysgonomonadaceae bacterium PH5-43]